LLYAAVAGSDDKLIIGGIRLSKYRPAARNPARAIRHVTVGAAIDGA
jgi:hypothetical protein